MTYRISRCTKDIRTGSAAAKNEYLTVGTLRFMKEAPQGSIPYLNFLRTGVSDEPYPA